MSEENIPSEILGKKIFFVNPTVAVRNQVIEELVQEEYEVYVAEDHSRLARALKKFPDSVVFVNINEKLAEEEWEKWIRNLMSTLPNIKIGVFSNTNDDKIKDKYINDMHVPCGFTFQKLDMSKSISGILDILKGANTKGRRKYIRVSLERETTATLNMPLGGNFVNGIIKDISVVGISFTLEQEMDLPKNTLLRDIQIKLQTTLLKVEAIVFGSRMNDYEKIYVLLFTQRIDPEVRTKIRKYIQHTLQSKMDKEIK
jgi:hypothetical protein